MAWIDHKMAYNMVLQKLDNSAKIYKMFDEDKVYREYYEQLESGIDNRRKKLSCISGRCDIIIFVIVIMPLNHILRKCTGVYELIKSLKESTT